MTLEKAFTAYLEAGLSVIPVNAKKLPTVAWKAYQERKPTAEEFLNFNLADAAGVAIVAGPASGGVECIDIDTKNDPTGRVWRDYFDKIPERLQQKMLIQKTPSGGYHLVYRCPDPGGNRKLAKHKDGKAIIETRGKGGYFVAFPSPGYTVLQGDLLQLTEISLKDRDLLMNLARQLDRASNQKRYKTKDDLEAILQQIESNAEDITNGYNERWLRIGFGLQDYFGEAGRAYFHRISRFHPDYDQQACDDQYDKCLLNTGNNKATIKTVFHIFKEAGYTLYKSGGPITSTAAPAKVAPRPAPAADGDKKMTKAQEEHELIKAHILAKNIRYNNITQRFYQDGDPIDDWHTNTWTHELMEVSGIRVSADRLWRYVQSGFTPQFNPVQDYFDGLQYVEYDDPLQDFLSTIEFKDGQEYKRKWIKKWLVSIVAHAYGHITRNVLVLIGPQSSGKTQFFTRLLPPDLSGYWTIKKMTRDKDSEIMLAQKLLIVDDEFDSMTRTDSEHFKSIVTQARVTIRQPYERLAGDLQRIAVLAGTSNKSDIINDPTGNTRILPVEIAGRDFAASDQVDREKLFAQLVDMWRTYGPEACDLTREELQELQTDSEEYQLTNKEAEGILQCVRPAVDNLPPDMLTATQIAARVEAMTGIRMSVPKIGAELKRLGFEQVRERINGRQLRVYLVRKVEPDQTWQDLIDQSKQAGEDDDPF